MGASYLLRCESGSRWEKLPIRAAKLVQNAKQLPSGSKSYLFWAAKVVQDAEKQFSGAAKVVQNAGKFHILGCESVNSLGFCEIGIKDQDNGSGN